MKRPELGDRFASTGFVDFQYLQHRAGSPEGGRALFEEVVTQLVAIEHPDAQNVRPAPGDWGIDALVGELDGVIAVWQAKYFVADFGPAQRRQVERSIDRVVAAGVAHGFSVGMWTLCLPVDLPAASLQWWARVVRALADQRITGHLWSRTQLISRLVRPAAQGVRSYYFPPPTPAVAAAAMVSSVGPRPGGAPAGSLLPRCMPPKPPPHLVDRAAEYEAVRSAVLSRSAERSVLVCAAVEGPGGVGKTVLAQQLCADDDVARRFPDGVHWITVGQRPDVASLGSQLIAALTGRFDVVSHADMLRARLTEALDGRAVLLVLDDVWDPAHVEPFAVTTGESMLLLTSRRFDVWPGAVPVEIGFMTEAEALPVLTRGLEFATCSRPVQELGRRLGYWPLLLDLANRQLHHRVRYGQDLQTAVADLVSMLAARGPAALDLTSTRDVDARRNAFAATVECSLTALAEVEVDRLMDLAAFREDCVLDVDVLTAVWGVDESGCRDTLVTLADLRLVELDLRLGQARLHDVIREYLLNRRADWRDVHERIATRLFERAQDGGRVALAELARQLSLAEAWTTLMRLPSTEWYDRFLGAMGDTARFHESLRYVLAAVDLRTRPRDVVPALLAAYWAAELSDVSPSVSDAELLVLVAEEGVQSVATSVERLEGPLQRSRAFTTLAGHETDAARRQVYVRASMSSAFAESRSWPRFRALASVAVRLGRLGEYDHAIHLLERLDDVDTGGVPGWAVARVHGEAAQAWLAVGRTDRAQATLDAAVEALVADPATTHQVDHARVEILAAAAFFEPHEDVAAEAASIRSGTYRRELFERIVMVSEGELPAAALRTLEALAVGTPSLAVPLSAVRAVALGEALDCEHAWLGDPVAAGLLAAYATTRRVRQRAAEDSHVARVTAFAQRAAADVADRYVAAPRPCSEGWSAAVTTALLDVGDLDRARALVAARRSYLRRMRPALVGGREATLDDDLRRGAVVVALAGRPIGHVVDAVRRHTPPDVKLSWFPLEAVEAGWVGEAPALVHTFGVDTVWSAAQIMDAVATSGSQSLIGDLGASLRHERLGVIARALAVAASRDAGEAGHVLVGFSGDLTAETDLVGHLALVAVSSREGPPTELWRAIADHATVLPTVIRRRARQVGPARAVEEALSGVGWNKLARAVPQWVAALSVSYGNAFRAAIEREAPDGGAHADVHFRTVVAARRLRNGDAVEASVAALRRALARRPDVVAEVFRQALSAALRERFGDSGRFRGAIDVRGAIDARWAEVGARCVDAWLSASELPVGERDHAADDGDDHAFDGDAGQAHDDGGEDSVSSAWTSELGAPLGSLIGPISVFDEGPVDVWHPSSTPVLGAGHRFFGAPADFRRLRSGLSPWRPSRWGRPIDWDSESRAAERRDAVLALFSSLRSGVTAAAIGEGVVDSRVVEAVHRTHAAGAGRTTAWAAAYVDRLRDVAGVATTGLLAAVASDLARMGELPPAVSLLRHALVELSSVVHDGLRAQALAAISLAVEELDGPDRLELIEGLVLAGAHSGLSFDAISRTVWRLATDLFGLDRLLEVVNEMAATKRRVRVLASVAVPDPTGDD